MAASMRGGAEYVRNMERFTGDYYESCACCNQPIEFALGIQIGREPIAMHFGPDGPTAVRLHDVRLLLMVDDDLDVTFRFDCPLCGGESNGRISCTRVHGQA